MGSLISYLIPKNQFYRYDHLFRPSEAFMKIKSFHIPEEETIKDVLQFVMDSNIKSQIAFRSGDDQFHIENTEDQHYGDIAILLLRYETTNTDVRLGRHTNHIWNPQFIASLYQEHFDCVIAPSMKYFLVTLK